MPRPANNTTVTRFATRATPRFPLTIYYDASCPLCAAEMHALRDYDRDSQLRLIDCSCAGFTDSAAAAAGLTQAELMRMIHARDAAGRWYRGVDVFEHAYRVAGIDAVARFWAGGRLRPLLERLYLWIARNRMWFSRLRANALFGWCVRRAAQKAQRRACRVN
ncbi:MAG: DUF393 domain-containing protein [Gammaproteobacteria bacterium]|nr:DUF393 domain-containing protein [Gammaproteobacteria bacterium]